MLIIYNYDLASLQPLPGGARLWEAGLKKMFYSITYQVIFNFEEQK
jgi:hypothetical protein